MHVHIYLSDMSQASFSLENILWELKFKFHFTLYALCCVYEWTKIKCVSKFIFFTESIQV